MLEALEREDFGRLPGGIFNISFARQYAAAVGLETDTIGARLEASISGEQDLVFHDELLTQKPLPSLKQVFVTRMTFVLRRASDKYLRVAAGAVTAVLLIGFGFFWDSRVNRLPNEAEQAVEQESQVQAIVNPPSAIQTPAEQAAPIRLDLLFSDTVWVSALADGERVFKEIMHVGENRTIEADEQVHLFIGNAGGLSLVLNGEMLPLVGDDGQVRRVKITPSGLTVLGGTGLPNLT